MPTPTAILLVEDEPNSAFFVQHLFRKLDLPNPLRVARDGQEAIDYLDGVGAFADRQSHPFPGLVLLDLNMPKLAGFEVLRRIRASSALRALIVIILTASSSNEDIAQAYLLGANAYLVKPLQIEELELMVKAIKDFWLVHNQA